MKKLCSIILAAILAASTLVGCGNTAGGAATSSASAEGTVSSVSTAESGESKSEGGQDSNLSKPGEFPIVKEPVNYTVMTQQTNYITDMNTNDFIKWYGEKTGVNVTFELVAESAVKEKVNLTLASNKLPDAFLNCGIGTSELIKYGEQGTFLPINDLVEEQGHYIKELFENNELLPKAITAPNGSIYALPAVNECYHCFYASRAWINEEWLKNVNMEYPNTTEELYQVLKAFKEKDANGNGDPNDEIPMMGSDQGWYTRPHDFLLNSFLYFDPGTKLALENGTLSFTANTPEFKEGLIYIKKLYDEGLIDPVSLTQTGEQFAAIGGNPESIELGVSLGATWWSGLGNDAGDPLQRSKQYVGLSPLEGPKKERNVVTAKGGIVVAQMVITTQCEDPAPLFRWGEGMYDEEITKVSELGVKGEAWDDPDEGTLGMNGKPALYKILKDIYENETQNFCISNFATSNRTAAFRAGAAIKSEEDAKWGIESRLERETRQYFEPYASDKAVPTILMDAADSAERARLDVPISDYVLENIVAFLSGTRDIEAEWEAYVNEFKALELDKYVALMQKGYDAQYK